MSSASSGSTNANDLASLLSLVWPTVNLYPGPQDQEDGHKNWCSGAKRGRLGRAPAAAQMGQPWDALQSDQHLPQGGQVGWGGVESELTGGVGKRCGAGEMS